MTKEQFLHTYAFKNVSGNWQFKGHITPEQVFKALMNMKDFDNGGCYLFKNDDQVRKVIETFDACTGMEIRKSHIVNPSLQGPVTLDSSAT